MVTPKPVTRMPHEWRRGRSVGAVGRFAIGLKRHDEIARIWCALDNVVGEPRVSARVKSQIARTAKQNGIVAGIVHFHCHRPRIRHARQRRITQVAKLRQCVDRFHHVLPRIVREIRKGFSRIACYPATVRFGQPEKLIRDRSCTHAASRLASDRETGQSSPVLLTSPNADQINYLRLQKKCSTSMRHSIALIERHDGCKSHFSIDVNTMCF